MKHFIHKFVQLFWISLLLGYSYIILEITLFSGTGTYIVELNFKLFSTFSNIFDAKVFLFENIIMFIPYSILLYLLLPCVRKSYKVICIGLISSSAIEALQYITKLGRFQIDDIMTNTFGMLLGYWIINIIFITCKKVKITCKRI